jgi:acyl-CoA thioesterase
MHEAVKEHIREHDQLGKLLGVELVSVGDGTAEGRLEIGPRHLNSVGTVHGGALFTLSDIVFAAAANSPGNVAVAAETSITFLKAVSSGVLTARAEEVSRGRKLSTYLVRITDGDGELVSLFRGLAYRKRESLVPGTGGTP